MKGKLTDPEWIELTEKTIEYAHTELRLGQSYMLALHDMIPEIYDIITNTENDPFYDDKKIYNFMVFLNT